MTRNIQMVPLPLQAERLIELASEGGIEVYVRWCGLGNEVLFTMWAGKVPTFAGLAAITEIAERFTKDAEFREAVEMHSVAAGSAVQAVDKPAWAFRPVEPSENAQ